MSLLPVGFGSQGGGYTIENSLRLRSSASAYLSRTFGSGGNLKTYTISFWIKRGKLGAQQFAFTGFNGSISGSIQFTSSDTFEFNVDGGVNYRLITTQVFRDPSAWYHVVCVADTTQATSSNRLKIYVNGVQVTSFGTATYPTLNYDTKFFGAYSHWIGASQIPSLYTDGYLAEFNAIDGQALTPSDFGEYNADTGVWQPAAYAGTYGTNGFYLPFSDATNTTTLAEDASGNGNDWTPNNISLTSGATYDSMTDTPTPYADGGNYAVLSPVHKSANATLSDGNLKIRSAVVGANNFSIATITLPTDKFYFEVTAGNNTGAVVVCEVGLVVPTTQTFAGTNSGIQCVNGGLNKIVNGVYTSIGSGLTTGTVLGFAYDLINGLMTIYRNGTAVATDETIPTTFRAVLASVYRDTANDVGWEFNFGQRPFAYTPPTGFKALHTGNLPDSTIVDGSQYFDVVLYTAATSDGTYTEGNLSFRPDFSWIKNRNNSERHFLSDVVRGNTSITDKFLVSDSNATEGANGVTGTTFSVTDTGYEFVETSINAGELFFNGRTYVGWNWRAGTAFSNDAGTNGATVASAGSVNQDAGFSIITHEAQAGTYSFYHGLGVAPSMFVFKNMDAGSNWVWWQNDLATPPTTKFLYLNLPNRDGASGSNWLQSVTPNVIELTAGQVHGTSGTYVAYAFAEVEGYSKFGSYTGNGVPDGVFVHLGFRARYLLIKETGNANSWEVYDTARNSANVQTQRLFPNDPQAEATTNPSLDILSNGFKCRAGNTGINRSGGTYIYMAFAENPFKNSLAR